MCMSCCWSRNTLRYEGESLIRQSTLSNQMDHEQYNRGLKLLKRAADRGDAYAAKLYGERTNTLGHNHEGVRYLKIAQKNKALESEVTKIMQQQEHQRKQLEAAGRLAAQEETEEFDRRRRYEAQHPETKYLREIRDNLRGYQGGW